LYRLVTGRDVATDAPLDCDAVNQYVLRRLAQLRDEAEATRLPIPVREIEKLLLTPSDIPSVAYNSQGDSQWRFMPQWEELDEADLSALDPEWRSLVGFRYESPTACYVFHLPLRTAERFVPADEIRRLASGGQARESGEYFGRAITEEESLAHPVSELLEKLGVEVALVCPNELQDKQDYIAEKAAGRWDFYADEEYDEDEEDWLDSELDELDDRFAKDLARMDKQIKRRASDQDQCPRCRIKVGAGAVRFEHWHSAHPDVESVTVKHAAWLTSLDKSAFESLGIAPDFRAAVDRAGESVARHWRIETLEMASARSTN
jgi:hypothetical protein